jgi:TP901 family phage tail tape measure protein
VNFVSSITLLFHDAFSSGMGQARAGLDGISDAADSINRNGGLNQAASQLAMLTSATQPLRDALSGMLDEPSKMAGTFESSLKNIQVVTGYTAEEMGRLRGELAAFGANAAAGPLAVAEAYNDVAGGITNTAAQMGVLAASTALAEAGQADLGVAANGMVKVMNAYGFSALDAAAADERAGFAADVFTQTVGMGVGSLDAFVSAMSPIAGLSASVGVGFDELGAAMAYATSKGQPVAVAATQMKAAMISLLNPNKTLADALEAVGITSGSAMLKEYGLAASLDIVSQAVGGSQDAMTKALGSSEALQAAVALTDAGYAQFAADFSGGMDDITASAQGVQLESLEMKMARLSAASSSLQLQIGASVNEIKGRFVDIGLSFMSGAVAPIMNSPVGPQIAGIAAYAGMGAKGLLDLTSGALNAASQISALADLVANKDAIFKMFQGTLKILGAPFKGVAAGLAGMGKGIIGALPALGSFIASGWATAAAWIAAAWPVLAVIAAVAALAAGVYLLVKNWSAVSGFFKGLWDKVTGAFSAAWNWIKNLIFGAPDWVLAAVAAFMPLIGIPALVIKHWDAVKAFFASLWSSIVSGVDSFVSALPGFFTGLWTAISAGITAAWNIIAGFFTGLWTGISAGVVGAWNGILEFFSNLWANITAGINAFIGWVDGIVGAFLAPFKAIGDGVAAVFGGIKNAVSGALGKIGAALGLNETAAASGAALNATFAQGITQTAQYPAAAFNNSLAPVAAMMPHSDADAGPLARLSASGRALTETFAAGMGQASLATAADETFRAAAPPEYLGGETISFQPPSGGDKPAQSGARTIHIQNLYVQAEDCRSVFDFVKTLMAAVYEPAGAA